MSIATASDQNEFVSWDVAYDDVAHTMTINGTGPGRCTLILEQADGKRAAAQFVQQDGVKSTPIPVPPDIVPTLARAPVLIVIPPGGTGTRVFNNTTLRPIAPTKPGGTGTFIVVGSEAN